MFWWLWAFVVALLPLLFILSRNYNIFMCVSSGPWAYNCWVKWLLFPIYWLAVNFAIPLFCPVAFYMQLNTLENLCILYMAGCFFLIVLMLAYFYLQHSLATDLQNLSMELRKKQSTYLQRLRQQKEVWEVYLFL